MKLFKEYEMDLILVMLFLRWYQFLTFSVLLSVGCHSLNQCKEIK